MQIFSPEQILSGARAVIEESEYLPSLNRMLRACENRNSELGLPTPREAYLEACNAPSPKAAHDWSHPAVYHAGRLTGWRYLASASEAESFPVFHDHYRAQMRLVATGQELTVTKPAQLDHREGEPLSKAENLARMDQLKASVLDD